MYGKGLLKGLGITLKHQFEKNITEQYPEQMPQLAERYRGCLVFEPENCIACGICAKTCPNNVISMETYKDANTGKKKLLNYSIDLQYCMFCNFCIEACPKDCLHFNHNFELATFKREDIKIVYEIPRVTEENVETDGNNVGKNGMAQTVTDEAAEKKKKQIDAMYKAIQKNSQKVLARILDNEEDIEIMSTLLQNDEKKAAKMAELMIEDKEKAKKIAQAFVKKEIKDRG